MRILNKININAPPEAVFYWLEDPRRAMKWMTSVSHTKMLEEKPEMVGTTFVETIQEGGRSKELHGIVTDFVRNNRLGFHLEGDLSISHVTFTLEEKGDTTLLTQKAEVQFKGMFRVIGIFLGLFLKRQIVKQAQDEFARLKELCEQATNEK